MDNLLCHVSVIDSLVQQHSPAKPATASVRRQLRNQILSLAPLPTDSDLTLAKAIGAATASCPSPAKRTLAAVLLRLASSSGTLTEEDLKDCRRDIVQLVETACPDLTKDLVNTSDQNHEKIEALKHIHHDACEKLEQLHQPFASLQDLAMRRRSIMKSINHKKAKSYLNAFGFNTVHQLIESLLGQVESIVQARGHELQTTIQQLLEDIPTQGKIAKSVLKSRGFMI